MIRKRLLLIVLALAGCANPGGVWREPVAADRIRPVADFSTFTELSQFLDHVGYLEAGTRVPLKLRMENDWLGVDEEEIHLVVKKRVYMRLLLPKDYSREKLVRLVRLDDKALEALSPQEEAELLKDVRLLVSPDAAHWASVGDGPAVKEVFDIQSGNLSLGMGLLKSDGLWAVLTLKLLRQEDR